MAVSVAEARALILSRARPLEAEEVALADALDRVLAVDIEAPGDVPPFDTSAMDGYAVRAADTASAPLSLRLTGESRAGTPSGSSVGEGEIQRISTGAPLPAGADAVIRQELTTAGDGSVSLAEAVGVGNDVRYAGEDVRAGDTIVRAGLLLGPAELGVLASLNVARPVVARRPRVALLGTGDELVDPGPELAPGQIRDTNGPALTAMVARAGATVVHRARVGDDLDATVDAISAALSEADVLVTAGGISVGPHDHIHPALARLGIEEVFSGVSLRPGKPTTFAVTGSGQLVFALPGNPVSALVCFQLFALPAIDAMLGVERSPAVSLEAIADERLPGIVGRTTLVRCRAWLEADGWHVRPTARQGSHMLTSMLGVDALALVPDDRDGIEAGDRVTIEFSRT